MNKIEWDPALAIEMYNAPKVSRFDDKVIDKEASEGAGIDIIVNPNPKDIIPLL